LTVGSPVRANEEIRLVPGQSEERVDRQAVYFSAAPGESLEFSDALAAYHTGKFSGEAVATSGRDPFARNLWIAIRLVTPPGEEGAPMRRVIGLGGIFVVLPQVYLVDGESSRREILAGKTGDQGTLVPRYFTYLRTQSFDLPAGRDQLVLINTTHADRPTIGVFREGELGNRQVVATLIKAGFTFTLLIIGIILAVISIVTKRRIGLLIAIGYSLVVIQVDASLFTTTFSASPMIGRQIWEVLTLLPTFFLYYSFLFVFRDNLRLSQHPWLVPLAILLPLPLIWVAWISDTTTDIIWAYYTSLLLFAAIIGLRFDIAPRLRMIAGAIMLTCVVGAVLVEPYYLGRYLPDLTIEYLRDGLRLLAAVGILFMVLVDMRRTRLERDRMTSERIEALQVQAETDRRLLETEREYIRARDAASRRKQQLAAASHDIRQPLFGLRQTLANEAASITPGVRTRLGEAIDYLEQLTEEYGEQQDPAEHADEQRPDSYPVELILRTVDDMFSGEAGARNVELRIENTAVTTDVPALALIRAVSNLVANALRHAEASQVSVQVTEDDGPSIEIRDDGRGFEAGEIERLQNAGEKGAESEGNGLGLAIVQKLANRHGFQFTITSSPGAGTRATIKLS
ncbi:MAG: HAMP domain-containing sensor histidine kinase, partial [Pseudomonadota bacterium]